jgi:hypothetical protein
MNKIILFLFLFIAATVLMGCHSPATVSTQASPPAMAAPPPFRAMLITVFGTHPTPDGSWKIDVSGDSIAFGHPSAGTTTSFTADSQGWRAKAGWFVFVESESRVWAYDGGRQIYLDTEISKGGNNYSGAIYYGIFRAASFDSNFPCAVPAEVISHLPEQNQKEILKQG